MSGSIADTSGPAAPSGFQSGRPRGDAVAAPNATPPVYEVLRSAIMSGQHAPGARLIEAQLARSLGVSRTPVRAALARLEGDGLVHNVPNKGAFVADWTDMDFEEVYELRIRLEPYAAKLAAGHMDEAELDRLDEVATTMVRLVETQEEGWMELSTELNADLHSSVLHASQSPRLISIVTSLTEQPLIRRAISLRPRETSLRNFEQHHQILQAVRQGDGEWAESLMTAHILGARQALRVQGGWQTESAPRRRGRR